MQYGKMVGRVLGCAVRNLPGQLKIRRTDSAGVNLVTFGALANGVGEASRVVGSLLAKTELPVVDYSYDVLSDERAASRPGKTGPLFPMTISALNASDHLAAAGVFSRLYAPSRHRIGVWHWEVDVFPLLHRMARVVTDEIWTTSQYQQELMAAQYKMPVHVLPLPVSLSPVDSDLVRQLRARLPHPEAFLIAFQFDWNSSRQRKNPEAAVKAFLRAFPVPKPEVALVMKSINGDRHPQDVAALRALCGDRADVVIIDEFWPAALNDAFFHALDCYVSLHRSEGFGLTMAKAMAAGKPVIATGFSGNLDFMDERTALLVPWTYTSVGPGAIYPENARWAEPDVDAAADLMRLVVTDSAARARIGAAASEFIASTRRADQSVSWVAERVAQQFS